MSYFDILEKLSENDFKFQILSLGGNTWCFELYENIMNFALIDSGRADDIYNLISLLIDAIRQKYPNSKFVQDFHSGPPLNHLCDSCLKSFGSCDGCPKFYVDHPTFQPLVYSESFNDLVYHCKQHILDQNPTKEKLQNLRERDKEQGALPTQHSLYLELKRTGKWHGTNFFL